MHTDTVNTELLRERLKMKLHPASRLRSLSTWLGSPTGLLYSNYLSSTWGCRMWTFSLGLFFVVLGDSALLLSAASGFLSCASLLLFGGIIGSYIDRTDRLVAVRRVVLVQKTCVVMCASLICVMFSYGADFSKVWGQSITSVLQVLIVLLAVTAEVATITYQDIVLHKDWFVVVTHGDSHALADLNAGTRALDLLSNTLSPALTGHIMAAHSRQLAAAIIVLYNAVTAVVELHFLSRIYTAVPEMSRKMTESQDKFTLASTEKTTDSDVRAITASGSICNKLRSGGSALVESWTVYFQQSVLLAGLAFGCLWMTVLGFDSVTVGYIYSNHIAENTVGLIMGVGSVAGVVGAWVYTRARRLLGLHRTGLLSLTAQLSCLLLCLVSVFLPGTVFRPAAVWGGAAPSVAPTAPCREGDARGECTARVNPSIAVFLVGLCASRLGLYVTELVVTQILQENVAETQRGIVNGTQWSINKLMALLKFILILFLPQIETFGYLIMLTFVFISMAFVLFAMYCYRVSGYSFSHCLRGEVKRGGWSKSANI